MVRALLDDSKTQTRRVVKGKALDTIEFMSNSVDEQDGSTEDLSQGWLEGQLKVWSTDYPEEGSESIHCPYGTPGDQLWVRETWGLHAYGDDTDWHRGACTGLDLEDSVIRYRADWGPMQESCHWRPSIHMPRAASRITLEITGVRVERLQDISEADAWAEGCIPGTLDDYGRPFPAEVPHPSGNGWQGWDCARDWYADLWEDINGPDSWEENPWVWVVEFKVMKP